MGKKIAIVFGVLIVALMVFMLSSGSGAPQKDASRPEIKPQDFAPKKQENVEVNLQDSDDIKKIKAVASSMEEQAHEGVSKRYLTSCSSCHGKNGEGRMAPKISGKSKDEILARLKEYKENKVQNTLMKGLLTNVSDEALNELADEISNFKEN